MINQGLFPIDEKFLYAIIRLEDSNNPDWGIVKEKIGIVADFLIQSNLHGFPDVRINYSERFNVLRGFGMALDLLRQVFSNAPQLVNELKDQNEFLEAQERSMEGRGEGE